VNRYDDGKALVEPAAPAKAEITRTQPAPSGAVPSRIGVTLTLIL
jgi:hypothetical protein